MMLIRTATLVAAFLPIVVLTTVSQPADRDATTASASTTAAGGTRYFEYPLEIRQTRVDCFKTEREARGIPGDRDAYVAWWTAHAGTSLRAEWSAAYDACKTAHELPGGKWNWAAMVEVSR